MSIVEDLNDYYLFEVGLFKLNYKDFNVRNIINKSFLIY